MSSPIERNEADALVLEPASGSAITSTGYVYEAVSYQGSLAEVPSWLQTKMPGTIAWLRTIDLPVPSTTVFWSRHDTGHGRIVIHLTDLSRPELARIQELADRLFVAANTALPALDSEWLLVAKRDKFSGDLVQVMTIQVGLRVSLETTGVIIYGLK